jgi:hypothetical protein
MIRNLNCEWNRFVKNIRRSAIGSPLWFIPRHEKVPTLLTRATKNSLKNAAAMGRLVDV